VETGRYAGLDRYEARRQVLSDLEELGLLEKTGDYVHSVGRCQRCSTEIEPLVSLQWFVKMKPLAEPAVKVVLEGRVRFVPERFTRIFLHWMEHIRDWCISRQIWWGHRIPAWYCHCGEMVVSREDPTRCPSCGAADLEQDPDVLDTWFSSALWPFSTLGWPDDTPDLQHYFPTTVLVTGYDIITFWVARMIFMSLEFMDDIPFEDVCVHGLVRDALGRKMSKSLGNGVDPLEIIEQYGADTLRFTLITGQAPGNDQRFRNESVEASRNFANKIWNASRYVLMNLGHFQQAEELPPELSLYDRWILDRFNRAVKNTTALLEDYELGEAARGLYEFIWGDFCDWYIELSKIPLYGGDEREKEKSRAVLCYVLEGTLRLLHPFMPFITEEIWQCLPRREEGDVLVVQPWPQAGDHLVDEEARAEMELLIEIIRSIRTLRSELNLSPAHKSPVVLRSPGHLLELLQGEEEVIGSLSRAEPVTVLDSSGDKPSQALSAVAGEVEVYLPLAGVVDLQQEIARLEKEFLLLEEDLQKVNAKLNNENFLKRAPLEVIDKEKNKKEEFNVRREKYLARLEELKRLD